ncbi:MAG: DUF1415 family protein [Betaproteobacteria bacterium]|nr:DUF1415 family protein [Betaproteobacteria bacterium]
MTGDAMALAARYLESVIEGLDLCPYARPARRAGGVRMERIGSGHGAEHCAMRVAELAQDDAAEAILLVFDLDAGDPRHEVRVFETFLREFQNLYRATRAPAFYSVMFHPLIEERVPRTTPDSLIQVIRRAPVPMIQCLRASVMEAVRAQAQSSARERLAAGAESAGWALTDSVLSQSVAQANFERCGEGDGRRELEDRLSALVVRPNDKGAS